MNYLLEWAIYFIIKTGYMKYVFFFLEAFSLFYLNNLVKPKQIWELFC